VARRAEFSVLAAILSWLAFGFVLAAKVRFRAAGLRARFSGRQQWSARGRAKCVLGARKKDFGSARGSARSLRRRTAVLASDLHLGHVRHRRFSGRIARKIAALKPDIVFLAGDLFDGTKVDAAEVAKPWAKVAPPFGVYL